MRSASCGSMQVLKYLTLGTKISDLKFSTCIDPHALCFTLLYSALLCFTLLYLHPPACALLYSALLCFTLLYSALLCFTLLYLHRPACALPPVRLLGGLRPRSSSGVSICTFVPASKVSNASKLGTFGLALRPQESVRERLRTVFSVRELALFCTSKASTLSTCARCSKCANSPSFVPVKQVH
jgi:hypothetical protein